MPWVKIRENSCNSWTKTAARQSVAIRGQKRRQGNLWQFVSSVDNKEEPARPPHEPDELDPHEPDELDPHEPDELDPHETDELDSQYLPL